MEPSPRGRQRCCHGHVTPETSCRSCRGGRSLGKRLLCALFLTYLFAACATIIWALIAFLRSCVYRRRHVPRPAGTHAIPEWAHREPDPLIYSQYWLQSEGLAYTWQNPDIHLELQAQPGQPVDSHSLAPDTLYRIFARVWNGSPDAPVGWLPVSFSYLDFGIGGVPVAIGATSVDLPVKGAPGTPAVATIDWKTPATPGHYCLQVLLEWPFDANPANNLGQHNMDVKPLNSPRARFVVPVRNEGRRRLEVRLVVDAYELGDPDPCPPRDDREDAAARRRRVAAKHRRALHPVPEGWDVDLGAATKGLVLRPGQAEDVEVTITAPEGFSGRKSFNVSGIAGTELIGGVTLVVTGNADE